jgi:hypothetical protein
MAPLLDQHGAATSISSRRFSAACLMLKYPGLVPYVRIGLERESPLDEINDLRDNWWYAGDLSVEASAEDAFYSPPSGHKEVANVSPPSFLGTAQLRAAQEETKFLRALPAAATYLGKITTEFAKMHPEDPRIPEALHLTVKASRYGCRDDRSSLYSKKAFTLLHKNYPQSDWTKKTPYWY